MAKNVVNSRLFSARNFILAENTQFQSSPLLVAAKRYNRENLIGREDIQKFVGALAVENSDKGVFITTSDFNKGAYEYVENLSSNNKIVLINGNKLSEYIYEFNLGMQTEKIIEVKRLDSDFWDNLENEK